MRTEPLVHSHVTDVLPEAHPLAYTVVYCAGCKSMVHCDNNECMQTWVEWGPYALCGECFSPLFADGVLEWSEFEALCKGVG